MALFIEKYQCIGKYEWKISSRNSEADSSITDNK